MARRCRVDGILAAAYLLVLAACGPMADPPAAKPAGDGWREFQGSWNATGSRRTIDLGGERGALVRPFAAIFPGQGAQHPGMGRDLTAEAAAAV